MSVNYKDGKILVDDAYHADVCYDVANNLITAQFNSKGSITKYAVMNKFSVFSAFYNLISVDGTAFDWNAKKHVEMVGKKQVTTFGAKDFDMEVLQFLDQKNNCIYVQNKVTAKRDIDFRVVNNFGINYGSYVESSSIQFYKNIVNLTLESSDANNIATIACSNSDLRDSLLYVSNSHKITIKNIALDRSGNKESGSCINIDCTNFEIEDCEFYNCYVAIRTSCCNGQISTCSFENLSNAINANKASNILSVNNESIEDVDYGIISNGSIVFNYGNDLTGDVEDYVTTMYGRVFNTEREVAVASITDANNSVVNRGGTDLI